MGKEHVNKASQAQRKKSCSDANRRLEFLITVERKKMTLVEEEGEERSRSREGDDVSTGLVSGDVES